MRKIQSHIILHKNVPVDTSRKELTKQRQAQVLKNQQEKERLKAQTLENRDNTDRVSRSKLKKTHNTT